MISSTTQPSTTKFQPNIRVRGTIKQEMFGRRVYVRNLFVEYIYVYFFGEDVVANLTARFEEIQATVWWSGGNATFAGDEVCDTVSNHSGFMAPYKTHPELPPS